MEVETTNAFELQRQQIIARNRARLLALGIPEAVAGLSKLAPVKRTRAPTRPPKDPQEPSRHSARLRDQEMIARGEVPPDVEEGSELAQFIIDGECPRCGKVLSVGHQRHLDVCKGPPEPPTEEEIAAKAEVYKVQQKDRLKQLELGGLVDYQPAAAGGTAEAATDNGGAAGSSGLAQAPATQQQQQEEEEQEGADEKQAPAAPAEAQQQQQGRTKKVPGKGKKKGKAKKAPAAAAAAGEGGGDLPYAIFIVIGSRGDHYTIKLTNIKRICQCLDHRFRRHDCKHIRLILQQLGVAEDPTGWEQALIHQLDDLGAADADDVQRALAAEERALARKRQQQQQ